MKTKTNITNTRKTVTQTEGLGSESDKQFLPSDSKAPNTDRPRIDYAKRQTNRQLATRDLLAMLRTQAPDYLNLAQIVGKWVWILFTAPLPSTITASLAEFGFLQQNKQQVWHGLGIHTPRSFRTRTSRAFVATR